MVGYGDAPAFRNEKGRLSKPVKGKGKRRQIRWTKIRSQKKEKQGGRSTKLYILLILGFYLT